MMMKKMCSVDGFIAALDQSGGSSEFFRDCCIVGIFVH